MNVKTFQQHALYAYLDTLFQVPLVQTNVLAAMSLSTESVQHTVQTDAHTNIYLTMFVKLTATPKLAIMITAYA